MDKNGFFYIANGGTLFLDEVGEIGLSMQVKLLRVIENGEYFMVGDIKPQKADVRIIAATNRDLREMLRKGFIRDDFYYRISIIPITLPPLRERKEDIPLLATYFLNLFSKEKKVDMPGKMMEAIYHYDWPGNVRQLQSVIQRFVTLGRFDLEDLRKDLKDPESGVGMDAEVTSLRIAMDNFEKRYIQRALDVNNWNRGKTASVLQLDQKTLYRKMKKVGLNRHKQDTFARL